MTNSTVTNAKPAANGPELPADKIDFVDLYTRWERGNWSAMDIDFSQDKVDWNEKFDDFMRRAARWNYSLFFFGEDEVTDTLAPFIDAAPLEEQKYFLATQQVDEARHAIFFSRFFREVIGVDTDDYGGTLRAVGNDLTWGFKKVFGVLRRVSDELRNDRSPPKLAQAITMYHLVVEGTLAQTGQHFIADYLTRMNVLPGFLAGMNNVETDEQRHIAFGVKMLADLYRQDPDVHYAIREILTEVLPYSTNVFRAPNDDERYVTVFGETFENIMATGDRQLTARLQAAGIPQYGHSGVVPHINDSITPEERAKQIWLLVQAGFLGKGTQPLDPTDEALGYFFDLIKNNVSPNHGFKSPKVLQWDFVDASPWHLRIDNGTTESIPGRAESPDVTFRVSLRDWIAIADGREHVGRSILRGKLRPRGDLRTMMALPRVFGPT